METTSLRNFRLKEVEIINGGVSFKATWEEIHETAELDYKTTHTKTDYNFNNCQPAFLVSLLNPHALKLNQHIKDTQVDVKKVLIDHYGEEFGQYVIKLDYEFVASSDSPARATTNKIVMEDEYYDKAQKVVEIIEELIDNLHRNLVEGERFPVEEMTVEMEGNVFDIKAA